MLLQLNKIDNDNYYHYQGSYYVMPVFRDARAFAVPGLLLLLSLAAVLSPVIGAKPLPAAAVLEAFTGVCQAPIAPSSRCALLPRTLAGLLAGGALGLAGRSCKHSHCNPLADRGFWALTTAPASPLYWARRCLFLHAAETAMVFQRLSHRWIVAFTGSQAAAS